MTTTAPSADLGGARAASGRPGPRRLWARLHLLRGWIVALAVAVAATVAVRTVMQREKPIEVHAARVERGTVEDVVASTRAGSIRARRSADLAFEITGTVARVHAGAGARVRKGDVLLSLDARDQNAALAAAQRELIVLESLATEAQIRRDEATRERERALRLQQAGAAPSAELDRADTTLAVATAAHAAALARARTHRAQLERARVATLRTALTAPFDGVLADRFVELGEWVTPGRRVVHLFDPTELYVRADLDEVDFARVAVGLRARVTLDPYEGRLLAGRVSRVGQYISEIQEQNRTIEVEVTLEDVPADIQLKPGTSADVEVVLERRDDALRIPTAALLENDRVLTIGDDGRAHAVPVRTGLQNWQYVEVLEGLGEGARIVVPLGEEGARDGAAVTVTHEEQ